MSKKVTLIVGSLRNNSFNYQIANVAKEILTNRGIEANILDYKNVPLFNQDIEWPEPEEVKAVRNEVSSSDAIMVFSPIYNLQIPGVLKNLLDWLSRSLEQGNTSGKSIIDSKVIGLAIAGFGESAKALEPQLRGLFEFIRTNVVEESMKTTIDFSQIKENGDIELINSQKEELEKLIDAVVANI